ncbi:hypothetical protein ACF063_35450 [Streptomyces chartreusis]|uniref:hypothetical protein n=1 Tax=Streptomyces TaxID=1883 RepID=UPI001BDC0DF3|nr:hypothetical protein [Streptomyces sp. Tu102]MBT1090538.1 hypothetical protein [Streptomyces sp. Tu102]
MKAPVLLEPELEFRAGNRHIDPRYGISVYGPADADSPTGPRQIPIAVVGRARAVDIITWEAAAGGGCTVCRATLLGAT